MNDLTETIPFTEDDIKAYLDRCIVFWRKKRAAGDPLATYYIDAFQSVRTTLFGELLPPGVDQEPQEETA